MIKTKQILIALAVIGANVLHNMPLHTAMAAEGDIWWYGTNTPTANQWTTDESKTVTSGLTLTVEDGQEVDGVALADVTNIYGGYTSGSETVTNNSITFNTPNTPTIGANIYGADTASGDASGNSVNIKNGTFSGWIYGSKINNSSTTGTATKNSVNIADGTFSGKIFGGCNNASTATKNSVVIDGGTFKDINYGIIYGAQGVGVDGNSVTINNGTFKTDVYGGNAVSGGTATNNTVTINNGVFDVNNKFVYGGVSAGGDVTGNKVIINDGQFTGTNIWAGKAMGNPSGNATGNTVTIKGGTFNNITIFGSISNTGNATGNTVNIEGGTFNTIKNLYGGYVGTTGTSTNNTLNLNTKLGGTSTEVGYFQTMNFTLPAGTQAEETIIKTSKLYVDNKGGSATVNVYAAEGVELNTDDVITLVDASGGSISDNYNVGTIFGVAATEVTAGQVYTTDLAKVTIDNTSIKLTMLGLYSNSWYGTEEGGFTRKKAEAVAEGGILNVDGAGASFAGTKFFYGGYSETDGIEVKNNTVNVTGGEFGSDKNIYGGYSQSGPANNNTVNISGGTFNDGYKLYGGKGTASSGNTLNLKTKVGGKAAEVGYFQIMNFTLPTGIQAGDVMLATQSVAYDSTVIGVTAAEGVMLRKNDVITLVEADNVTGGIDTTNLTVLDGAAVVSLEEGKNLILTLLKDFGIKGGEEDRQKAPVEGIAAAVQTVNMSADLASGEGMRSLILETVGGFTNTFGALTAGHSKYKTGSHVDVDGWGVVVGAGKTKEWGNGEATSLGVFLEYGKGNFDTYNGSIHGDGNSENKGIGFMMRHKMLNNTYYEGNIRYGKVETDWSESEVGGYNTDSKYYGISVGMGHIFPAGKNEIDVYGRYTYGHVGSSDARVGTKDYHFDSVKSHRVRIGGKYNFKQKNSNAKPFVGLAWEHEFKGESKASIAGVGEAPAPSMKGNTGIMEVGCDWNLGKKWTAGISANAYVGKRQGWDGMARIVYNF